MQEVSIYTDGACAGNGRQAPRGGLVTFEKVPGHADRKPDHVSSEHERFNQLADALAVAAVSPP
jgi:ribonuclease HI